MAYVLYIIQPLAFRNFQIKAADVCLFVFIYKSWCLDDRLDHDEIK